MAVCPGPYIITVVESAANGRQLSATPYPSAIQLVPCCCHQFVAGYVRFTLSNRSAFIVLYGLCAAEASCVHLWCDRWGVPLVGVTVVVVRC